MSTGDTTTFTITVPSHECYYKNSTGIMYCRNCPASYGCSDKDIGVPLL